MSLLDHGDLGGMPEGAVSMGFPAPGEMLTGRGDISGRFKDRETGNGASEDIAAVEGGIYGVAGAAFLITNTGDEFTVRAARDIFISLSALTAEIIMNQVVSLPITGGPHVRCSGARRAIVQEPS